MTGVVAACLSAASTLLLVAALVIVLGLGCLLIAAIYDLAENGVTRPPEAPEREPFGDHTGNTLS